MGFMIDEVTCFSVVSFFLLWLDVETPSQSTSPTKRRTIKERKSNFCSTARIGSYETYEYTKYKFFPF